MQIERVLEEERKAQGSEDENLSGLYTKATSGRRCVAGVQEISAQPECKGRSLLFNKECKTMGQRATRWSSQGTGNVKRRSQTVVGAHGPGNQAFIQL